MKKLALVPATLAVLVVLLVSCLFVGCGGSEAAVDRKPAAAAAPVVADQNAINGRLLAIDEMILEEALWRVASTTDQTDAGQLSARLQQIEEARRFLLGLEEYRQEVLQTAVPSELEASLEAIEQGRQTVLASIAAIP